jgi:hypothetical protein
MQISENVIQTFLNIAGDNKCENIAMENMKDILALMDLRRRLFPRNIMKEFNENKSFLLTKFICNMEIHNS